jgi:hypothetical protein
MRMLKRPNRLDVPGLRKYLRQIVREHVEKPAKVRITSKEAPHTIRYKVSVAKGDRAHLTAVHMTARSLSHIMNRATNANVGKDGNVDNQFGITK